MMLGIAEKLFIEKYAKSPWNKAQGKKDNEWPLLEKLLMGQRLEYVDFALAKRILNRVSINDEAMAAFICHLSIAMRQGHLCVNIDRNGIIPSVDSLWTVNHEDVEVFPDEWDRQKQELEFLIHLGAQKIAPPLLAEASANDEVSLKAPICKRKSNYYFQRYWLLESAFFRSLRQLLNETNPHPRLTLEKVRMTLDELVSTHSLLPEQAMAILQSCENCLTVITGGPGTGKTHTAGIFLKIFWENLSHEQKKECQIELAAPTGKATANLEASIKRAMGEVKDFPLLTGKTLHALLGVKKRIFKRKISKVIPADILLVDESSMIDAQMMVELFDSIRPGCRLIMLGDRFQLPPVESGSLFSDLVSYLIVEPAQKNKVTELKTCLRAELKEIIVLAEKVKQGKSEEALEMMHGNHGKGLRYVPLEKMTSPKEIREHLLSYALSHFPVVNGIPSDPLELLVEFSKFRILVPLRKGMLGIEELNALFFQQLLARSRHSECTVFPIMIAKNDQHLGVFNGEVGLLVSFKDKKQNDYALFTGRDAKQSIRKIPSLMLPKFEYAFCLSVHKSQGSEFDHVVMVLPEGSEAFGRESLYTGITRARRSIEIWSSESVFKQMMSRLTARHSGVKDRLDGV